MHDLFLSIYKFHQQPRSSLALLGLGSGFVLAGVVVGGVHQVDDTIARKPASKLPLGLELLGLDGIQLQLSEQPVRLPARHDEDLARMQSQPELVAERRAEERLEAVRNRQPRS